MQSLVDSWMSHPLPAVLAYFSVGVFALIVFLAMFELVTKYEVWAEIRKGNVSAAMATGGKKIRSRFCDIALSQTDFSRDCPAIKLRASDFLVTGGSFDC